MADEHDDKTEDPTDHRRLEVREKGNVVRSIDLNTAASVLAAAVALQFFGGTLATSLAELLRKSLAGPAWDTIDVKQLVNHCWDIAGLLVQGVLPLLAVMFIAAVCINLAQVGFLLTLEPLQPNFARLNPISGFQRIFSIGALVKLGVSLLKLVLLTTLVFGFVTSQLPQYLRLSDLDTVAIAVQIGDSIVAISFRLAIALAILAVLDYGYQLWKFEQDIKMTKQEIRDEMRQMDGDPHIRQRRKEAHRKLVQARQMGQVKEADVIITNPTHLAIAIKYDSERMAAPIVVAKGQDLMAERIRQIAAEHRIPVIEKKPLARALFQNVKVGQPVPVDLYEAVAEILGYVYRLTGKMKSRR